MKLPISLVVITLNEERNLARCLASVPFASEIVVVDSHSTDKTVDIAKKMGAKVIAESWRGYGGQKKFAVSNATNDWVICLDADEVLSPELQNEIQNQFSSFNKNTVYQIPRKSWFLNQWINYGGWYPDYQTRIFCKTIYNWNEQPIHESVEAKNLEKLQYPILHYVFKNIHHQVATNNNYSTLQAQAIAKKKVSGLWIKILVKPIFKFLECYVLKLGFLDGVAGFIIAYNAAYSMFLKWIKVWEIKKGI